MQGIQAIRLILPFLLALVIAYLVKRPVAFLERKGMSRSLAIFLVYFLLVLVIALGIILIAPGFYGDIMEMMEVLPGVYEKYKSLIDKVIASPPLPIEGRVFPLRGYILRTRPAPPPLWGRLGGGID